MLAPRTRGATVGGATVAVVAVKLARALAQAQAALVGSGTHVAVVAGCGIELVGTSRFRVATVVGTYIVVVAVCSDAPLAHAPLALVHLGALISVVALLLIGRVLAPFFRVARIIGAGIPVVAPENTGRNACAVSADIPGGASITVIAGHGVIVENATGAGFAGIAGARVVVVALEDPRGFAHTAGAGIAGGAVVAVIARPVVVLVNATLHRVAPVESAVVGIVTVERAHSLARPALARVSGGADVAIVARVGVVFVAAACGRIARVIGAQVAVVAAHR